MALRHQKKESEKVSMEATTNRTSRERLAEWRLAQEQLWAEIERYCDLVAETMADTFYGPYDAS